MTSPDISSRMRILGPDERIGRNRSCPQQHWIATARIYADGTDDPPHVAPMDGTPCPDTGLDDRSHYFGDDPAFLRITWWGHDRDQVRAVVQQRYDAELAKRDP